jgi:transposase-like protein
MPEVRPDHRKRAAQPEKEVGNLTTPARCWAHLNTWLADGGEITCYSRCPYVKIKRGWVYLYRAVDREGRTVDFRLSPRRNVAAAKAFLRKARKSQSVPPSSITLDGYAASHRAVREMQDQGELSHDTKLRSSKYLNNMIEQDHRNVKMRIGPMLRFKRFKYAATTIASIELTHRIRKGQFLLDTLNVQGQAAPAVWYAVLAS